MRQVFIYSSHPAGSMYRTAGLHSGPCGPTGTTREQSGPSDLSEEARRDSRPLNWDLTQTYISLCQEQCLKGDNIVSILYISWVSWEISGTCETFIHTRGFATWLKKRYSKKKKKSATHGIRTYNTHWHVKLGSMHALSKGTGICAWTTFWWYFFYLYGVLGSIKKRGRVLNPPPPPHHAP